ncbi:MAG: Polyamine aminopropyltransferase [Alphaproteobacteria bacterium MarineAlpha10_Bin3]|jgi:spermidine synthase|nr:MAG: Polyamine aminopropyltransferase [Alphaproteobacteria bacterium MarineAlpha10_Bin3]PPR72089.1 MAG: Polyamine aminopropyltransferase [Alphaproteobacteria bacterium MarineAlpha4_Bin1]
MDWFEETLHPGLHARLRIDKLLYRGESEHQRLILFENAEFGRVLALNDVIQTTERDEFIYHEMLSHVPLLAHGGARKVLIVGGGDGGMLEEVLKHPGVCRATLVEIDASVIDFAKQYLRAICGDAFEDPRTHVIIADGLVHAQTTPDRYDVIIVDSTDPVGPGEALFSDQFYRACRRCLAPGGILVTQNGVPFVQGDELRQSLLAMKSLFADTTCYTACVPAYVGGCMAFGWASDHAELRATPLPVLAARVTKAGLDTRYYTPAVHQAAFALPGYIADLIE